MKQLFAATLLAAAAALPAKAEPYYLIAQIQVDDFETYMSTYGAAAVPPVLAAGGKVLVGTPTVNQLEGEWSGNWTVVIEFPSEDHALNGWYNNPEYKSAIPLRTAVTSVNNLVIAPGFVPPAQ